MNIPYALGQVVGWTDESLRVRKGYPRAAVLLKSELAFQYVELEDPESAACGGAARLARRMAVHGDLSGGFDGEPALFGAIFALRLSLDALRRRPSSSC
jgi:hypothetical protein